MGFGNKKDFGRRRGFSKGFRSLVDSLLAITKAYIERVTTDGGSVVNDSKVNDEYQIVSVNEPSIYANSILHVSRFGGFILDSSNFISKSYDLSSDNNDLIQPTASRQPLFEDGVIKSVGIKSLKLATTANIANQSTGSILWKGTVNDSGSAQVLYAIRDSSTDIQNGGWQMILIRNDANTYKIRISIRNQENTLTSFDTTPSFNFGEEINLMLSSGSDGSNPVLVVNNTSYSTTKVAGDGDYFWMGDATFVNTAIYGVFGSLDGSSVVQDLITKGFMILDGKEITQAEAQPIFDSWD